jgi:serine/threonine protein kinase
MSLLEDITITHYHLQQRLARGGMSEVYLALDIHTNQKVAIKLVHRDQTEYYERFRREITALTTLSHDHILPVFDSGEYGPWCYMVTPYIEGGTLCQRLKQGPLTLKETAILLEQVASALQCAHDHGILHRDIKPSNILLRDGHHAYLGDFGLVKNLGDASSLTQTGFLIGTPKYMAPELIDSPSSKASDLYALGVVLYQMLTGDVPFSSTTPMGIYWKHLQERPPLPSTINPVITPQVEEVILRALAKNPRHRFQSVQALAQAYRDAIDITPKMIPATITTLSIRQPRNIPRVMALSAVALLFFMALPAWLGASFYYAQQRPQAPALLTDVSLWTKYPTPLPTVPGKGPIYPTATATPTVTITSTYTPPAQNRHTPPTTHTSDTTTGQNGGETQGHSHKQKGNHQKGRNRHHKHLQ